MCKLCGCHYAAAKLLEQHVINDHGPYSNDEIKSIIEHGKLVPSQLRAQDCPFCDKWALILSQRRHGTGGQAPPSIQQADVLVPLTQFKRHLATHQEQIAIFALPRHMEGDDERSRDAANSEALSSEEATSRGGIGVEFDSLEPIDEELKTSVTNICEEFLDSPPSDPQAWYKQHRNITEMVAKVELKEVAYNGNDIFEAVQRQMKVVVARNRLMRVCTPFAKLCLEVARLRAADHMEETSGTTKETKHMMFNERLQLQEAPKKAGELSFPVDETWEQWFKNAAQTGHISYLREIIIRVSPQDVFPARFIEAARAGNWHEIPDFLRDSVRDGLRADDNQLQGRWAVPSTSSTSGTPSMSVFSHLSAPIAPVSHMPQVGADMPRVSVFKLVDGGWENQGTGLCRASVKNTETGQREVIININREADLGPSRVVRRVHQSDIYERKETTTILWKNRRTGVIMGLSFQDAAGCEEILKILHSLQENHIEEPDAPEVQDDLLGDMRNGFSPELLKVVKNMQRTMKEQAPRLDNSALEEDLNSALGENNWSWAEVRVPSKAQFLFSHSNLK